MIASLMRLRFATFCAKFQSARNNAMIRAAWLLLAGELSKEYEVIISSEQCNNKIKGLKKKWAEYCSDISSTGNNVDKPIVEPVCLELMEEYWTSGTGMQGESLADNDNVGSLFDSDSEDDNGNTGGRKRGKTVAEGLEPQHMEQFMEARFNSVIEQLQVQNQNLAALVELLRKD
ncbi:hypothetical protein PF004_g29455 [Phytophthora fragariae]|uniref:Myb/SANT-like domain-containing protein n=1 Tax=Phytophthora fragariae TaxID=53985 RepID=A0A6G0MF16_9STRA|nr:hypothetical protein PF004_g29455 [Phytophthora fragariae]